MGNGFDHIAKGSGISSPLSEHVNMLGALLGNVIEEQHGNETLEQVEKLRLLCKEAGKSNDDSQWQEVIDQIKNLSDAEIVIQLKAYTDFFHLINKAEQQEIIRKNRERAQASSTQSPRKESIAEAIFQLKQGGAKLDEVLSLVQQLDIQPTLTAHPTEARRRSVMYKQKRISTILSELRQRELTPKEQYNNLNEIRRQIKLLSITDEVRAKRLTVDEEVNNGLFFLRNTIWETIPEIYADVQLGLKTYYDYEGDLPVFLRFRSWIGSDRDGNPNVTPDVTRTTAITHRQAVLELIEEDLVSLRRELSISNRKTQIPEALLNSIDADATEISISAYRAEQYTFEPYRKKVSYMIARIKKLQAESESAFSDTEGPASYNSAKFIEDLELLHQCLLESGFEDIARNGMLRMILLRAKAFGFHMAALDVRQHSQIHENAVAEMLKKAGVVDNYAELDESQRLEILNKELNNPRPLFPHFLIQDNTAFQKQTWELLETFKTLRTIIEEEPEAIGSFIISMTHSVSDLLEVMLLAKETGLWYMEDDKVTCPLDIVPLFETIEDLEKGAELMAQIFENPIYQKQLAARGDFQEIMLGYSDSNKDGGFWMANWALHKGQASLSEVCRKYNIDFRLFHGRGGTVGRGGGRANQAILAMPASSQSGRIRFTEQGEVISFRYALPDIAHRHLEQIVNAMLLATHAPAQNPAPFSTSDQRSQVMEKVAKRSMQAYRDLIDDPELWKWYTQITPIAHISRLPIASRPVSRKSADEVDFNSLRAIPWGFAWTQTRYMVPGWYGIGAGLQLALDDNPDNLALFQQAFKEWDFFKSVLRNAQLEMARSRFAISKSYSRLSTDKLSSQFHSEMMQDFEKARNAILSITSQTEILDYSPVIKKSIALRNPYTDVLNFLQIELLERYRTAGDDRKADLHQALFLSINGVAAAMQSTG